MDTKKLLRRRVVEALTGLPRSSLYEKIADGDFPKPVRLGSRSVAWISSEVDHWITERITQSQKGPKR